MSVRIEKIGKHNSAVRKHANGIEKSESAPDFLLSYRGCDASGYDFRGWPMLLHSPDLRDADLSGADLRGVSLNWVYIGGANLDGIIIDDETFCLGDTGRDAIDTCLSMFQGGPEGCPINANGLPIPVKRADEVTADRIWQPS